MFCEEVHIEEIEEVYFWMIDFDVLLHVMNVPATGQAATTQKYNTYAKHRKLL